MEFFEVVAGKEEAARVQPTGSDGQVQIARMRAVAVAKFQLTAIPGRPEELARADDLNRRISIVSGGHGQVRVRLQKGREWLETQDFQVQQHQNGPASATKWCAPFLAFIEPHLTAV